MTDIFISYKKEDAGRVIRLVEAMRAEGLTVWWDHGIRAGSEWDKSIHENLYAAKVVIAIWSKASVAAPWVKEEATVGKNRGVLLPVKIDEVDPPLGFMMIQAADLIGWSGDRKDARWQFLLEAVNAIMRNEAPKAFEAPVKRQPARRPLLPLIFGGAALATAAVAALVFSGVLKDRNTPAKEAAPAAVPSPAVATAPPAAPSAVAAPSPAALPAATTLPPATLDKPASTATAIPPSALPINPPAPAPAPVPQITANEQQFWDKAMAEKSRQAFQSYLVSFPGGAYAQRARDILLTCRTEIHENWKPAPIGASQMARGVGETSHGMTPVQACDKAKADVRSQAKQICDTIASNGGYRNGQLTVTDVACTCNKTSGSVTVCVADVPYTCRWEMKVPERVEICG